MQEYEISSLTGKQYCLNDVVRIFDMRQAKLYIKFNVFPVDMYTTYDEKTGDDLLIMLFNRNESKELYVKWKNHELR